MDVKKLKISKPQLAALIVLVVLVVVLPVLLFVIKQQVRLQPKAAGGAQIYFDSQNYTLDPSNSAINILVDPAGTELGFADIKVQFDNTKVQLASDPVLPAPSVNPLQTPVILDTAASANAKSEFEISLALQPGVTGPTNVFTFVTLSFTAVNRNPGRDTLAFLDTSSVSMNVPPYPTILCTTQGTSGCTTQGATLDLNPAHITNTPIPPTDTPIIYPTVTDTPIPTPTTYIYPTQTPLPTPTSTSSNGGTNGCGGTCGSNNNCNSDLYCYLGYCRASACPLSTNCSCTAPTSTPKPTATPVPGNNNYVYPTATPRPGATATPYVTPIAYVTSAPYANPTLSPDLANNPFLGGQKAEPVPVTASPAVKLSWFARFLLWLQKLLRMIFGSR